jgi:hypothetical protein
LDQDLISIPWSRCPMKQKWHEHDQKLKISP